MQALELRQRLHRLWDTPPTVFGWLSSVDHKELGRRYIVTALAFLVLGGIEAAIMRLQLAGSDMRIVGPEAYDQLFSMHGITMIFWYASPILSGFGNFLLPLMLGARDMAFPRLNAFSYWVFLFSGLFINASLLVGQAPHGGWFAYVPYTSGTYSPGLNMDFYALGLIFLTVSTTVGAVNFIATVARHRAPGMAIQRLPLVSYSTVTTSVLAIVSLPALTVACLMLELDRHYGTHFFDVAHGGSPLLWQHTFWFFGHPWVYIIFLPATGMISMILPSLARRPIVGYPFVAVATILTGVVGLGVWVHHMFATGMNQVAMSLFGAASMTISLFSTVQVFAWIATLWTGRPVMTTAMRFCIGFIAVFVLGGLSGVVTAMVPFDWQITDTYFVVAHLHYVLIGANLFPVMAALYYWFPKMSGRMASERAGRASFWLMFVGFNVAFFPMHIVGLLGMPRRVWTYPPGMGWDGTNLLSTAGAFLLAVGILVSFLNFGVALRRGARAGRNPWNAPGLEWEVESPPPSYGTVHLPTVVSRYSGWDGHDSEHDPDDARVLATDRLTYTTSVLDAVPVAIARMPDDTIMPLLCTLALTGLFVALLLQLWWLAAGTVLLTLLCTAAWLWPEAGAEVRA